MAVYRVAVTKDNQEYIRPDEWMDIIGNDDFDVIQKAVVNLNPEDLPLKVHVGETKHIYDTGVPMMCQTYTLEPDVH